MILLANLRDRIHLSILLMSSGEVSGQRIRVFHEVEPHEEGFAKSCGDGRYMCLHWPDKFYQRNKILSEGKSLRQGKANNWN